MLQQLKAKYDCDIVVLTLGSEGSIAFDGDEFYEGKAYPIEEQVNRLGAGDAFDAGLLWGKNEKRGHVSENSLHFPILGTSRRM